MILDHVLYFPHKSLPQATRRVDNMDDTTIVLYGQRRNLKCEVQLSDFTTFGKLCKHAKRELDIKHDTVSNCSTPRKYM